MGAPFYIYGRTDNHQLDLAFLESNTNISDPNTNKQAKKPTKISKPVNLSPPISIISTLRQPLVITMDRPSE